MDLSYVQVLLNKYSKLLATVTLFTTMAGSENSTVVLSDQAVPFPDTTTSIVRPR